MSEALNLRARSQAVAVSLRLEHHQALDLARSLLVVADALATTVAWQVSPIQPVPLESPLLAVPLDLDARVGGVQVRQQPAGRVTFASSCAAPQPMRPSWLKSGPHRSRSLPWHTRFMNGGCAVPAA